MGGCDRFGLMTWFESLHPYVRGLIELAVLWIAGWLVWRLVHPLLKRLAHRTSTGLDDIVLSALAPFIPLWFVLAGVPIAARHALVPERYVSGFDRVAEFLVYLTLSLALASILSRFVAKRVGPISSQLPATTLTQNAIRIGVVLLGVVLGLSNIGIAVTPMLTALGVGSLAVALALQPTLTNLVAGFLISFARQVRIGDVVELEQGQMGVVDDISWRTVTLREPAGNLITVPNARMAELIVRNYSVPQLDCSANVQLAVTQANDLVRVEAVLLDAAREVLATEPKAVASAEPVVRFTGLADGAVQILVVLRAESAFERATVQSAFLRSALARLRHAGIELPLPQRVMQLNTGRGDGTASG